MTTMATRFTTTMTTMMATMKMSTFPHSIFKIRRVRRKRREQQGRGALLLSPRSSRWTKNEKDYFLERERKKKEQALEVVVIFLLFHLDMIFYR